MGLSQRSVDEDRRHVRRALSPAEVEALLRAARERPLRSGRGAHEGKATREETQARLRRTGVIRALVYALAVGTGLRRGELQRLRWCDVDLEKGRITVPARSAKSRTQQTIDLHPHLVEALRAREPSAPAPTDTVIPPGTFPTITVLWRDLEAAGIPRRDETGCVVDFHALRTTYVTWFAVNGEHPALAQAAARHANFKTTMGYYTDLKLMDTKGAVARLPLPRLDFPDVVKDGLADCAPDCALPRAQRRTGPHSDAVEGAA